MSVPGAPDTDRLIEQAAAGDSVAGDQLLIRHKSRLRRMIKLRLNPRLAARIDPSDIVQDSLIVAHQKLPRYLREQPIPFYPWLRQIAWERLIDVHRRHVRASNRAIEREAAWHSALPDLSEQDLARRLAGNQTSPSGRLAREEQREAVRAALAKLPPRDHEMLALLYLEQLSLRDAAAVVGITERAAVMRHLRALKRLRALLDEAR
jgi:RNA polymerase sigma-70 factor (ECF subfamily)